MTKKTLNTLLVLTFGLLLASANAQEVSETPVIKKRNPFLPQLPVKKEEPKIIPKPLITKTETKPKTTPKIKPKPVEPRVASLPSVTITGIVWNSDRPQAIINGRVMDIGDTIEDMKIIAIRKTGIDVSFNGASKTLKVN